MTLHDKLVDIQHKIKVPKDQVNSFGGYKFRNLEDIEQNVKPLLKEHGLTLRFEDEVVAVGDRVYIKATAILSDGETTINNPAYAREAVSKKGMDDSQLTGSTSSYARKYAASGLFLIDDTKDADSHDNTSVASKTISTPIKKADKPAQDPLAVAKDKLNKKLEEFGHDNNVKKKVIINMVLGKNTVDTEQEANEVMQALDDGVSNV